LENRFKVNFNDLEWENASGGARFKIFRQNGRQIRLLELGEDFVEEDWCVKNHVGLVLEGELEIDFDGKTLNYAAGEVLFISENENSKHKAPPVTPFVKLILIEDL
jgi:hypothetical protein